MQSLELYQAIEKFPSLTKHFDGVFSVNTIPKSMKKRHFLISNTKPDIEPGQHWFCIVKIDTKNFEYFDSLEVTESKLNDIKTLKLFKAETSIKFNETAVQSTSSTSCGLFVLYFLINRMHNLDLSLTLILNEIFQTNCDENENLVKQFAHDFL